MKKLTIENLHEAEAYIEQLCKISDEDTIVVKLIRIYDNGYFTSGGFTPEIFVPEKGEELQYEGLIYISSTAMYVPANWHEWEVRCFDISDENSSTDSGSLSGIDLIKAAEYSNMDNPPVDTVDGVFLFGNKKYNACIFIKEK